MPESINEGTRLHQPIILIRGFGGLGVEDEKRLTYQGFNDGTVYPHKRGENYIYEGMVLRFLKSDWKYFDTTNVVGYYGENVPPIDTSIYTHPEFQDLKRFFSEKDKVIFDPGMLLQLVRQAQGDNILKTIWVFRYYDLNDRSFETYAKALFRLVEFVQELAFIKTGKRQKPKINVIAHSMGGLIVREMVQKFMPSKGYSAPDFLNKIVTLGTPHQGISFQVLGQLKWLPGLDAASELAKFSPEEQEKEAEPGYKNFRKHFPLSRLLTVVGTDYRSYSVGASSFLNRVSPLQGEFGMNYNRSDGLVKQTYAQIPGAPRTFVHKCHGGQDSVVTSRESFEIATRFFFGDIYARLTLVEGVITRGFDIFGKSEFFLGVSIKPRGVDFELFHQSSAAENAYGPFLGSKKEGSLQLKPGTSGWQSIGSENPDMFIWEGFLDTHRVSLPGSTANPADTQAASNSTDLAMRLDFFVGERDLFGIGFSDNVVFRKQYYVHAHGVGAIQNGLNLYLHTSENFSDAVLGDRATKPLEYENGKWIFEIGGTGFNAKLKIELAAIPESGDGRKTLGIPKQVPAG